MMETRGHVILVDDEANLLRTLTLMLKRAGYYVYPFTNGQAARVLLFSNVLPDDNKPRILLSDLTMPDYTGLNLFEEVRRQNIEVALIAMTGHCADEIKNELRKVGCTLLLEKPFEPSELLAIVESVGSQKVPA